MLRRDVLRLANPEAYELIQTGHRYLYSTSPDYKKAWECYDQAYRQHGSMLVVPALYLVEQKLGLSSINLDLPRLAEETKDMKIILCYYNLLTMQGRQEELNAQMAKIDRSDPFLLFTQAQILSQNGNDLDGRALLKKVGSIDCCTVLARLPSGTTGSHSVDAYRESLYWHQKVFMHCGFVEESEILVTKWDVSEVYNDEQNLSMLLSCLDQLPLTSSNLYDKKLSRVDQYLSAILSIHLLKLVPSRRDKLLKEMDDPSIIASQVHLDHFGGLKQVIGESELLTICLLKAACSYLPGSINPFILFAEEGSKSR
jgi:hypothetical protein